MYEYGTSPSYWDEPNTIHVTLSLAVHATGVEIVICVVVATQVETDAKTTIRRLITKAALVFIVILQRMA